MTYVMTYVIAYVTTHAGASSGVMTNETAVAMRNVHWMTGINWFVWNQLVRTLI